MDGVLHKVRLIAILRKISNVIKTLFGQLIFDFLNSLSDEQQCAALYHLSAKWSAQKGGSHAGA